METYLAAIIGIVVVLVVLLILLIIIGCAVTLWGNDFPNKAKFVDTDVKLNGKTAIVTGSSKGIGATTAKELAKKRSKGHISS